MPGWFELSKNDKGKFTFVLKSDANEVVLRSEQYESRGAAEGGIASVQTNSAKDERYERKVASDGRFFFNLKAANHQVVGTSALYKTEASRDAALQATRACGPTATVKDAT